MSGLGRPVQLLQARPETFRIRTVLPRIAGLVYLFFCVSFLNAISLDVGWPDLLSIPADSDVWLLLFFFAPFGPCLLRVLVKFILVLRRAVADFRVSGVHHRRYMFTYAYLSPFLIEPVLDRWRLRPFAGF